MSIKLIEDFKMNNSGGAIPATQYGNANFAASVGTNSYANNGLSSTGLDLSFTGSAASANNGFSSYAIKNNLSFSTAMSVGFNCSDATYAETVELAQTKTEIGSNTVYRAKWSPDGNYLAVVTSNSTTTLAIYKNNGDGTLTVLTAPTQPTATPVSLAWHPTGNYLVVGLATSTSPLWIYSNSSGTLTKLSSPAIQPANNVYALAWTPDGNNLYVGWSDSTAPLYFYRFSGGTLTAQSTQPNIPNAPIFSLDVSADGNYLAVGWSSSTTPLYTYQITAGTGTLTRLTLAATQPTNTVGSVAWSPNGNYLAVGWLGSAPLYVYTNSGGVLTKISTNPSTPLVGLGGYTTLHWTADSKYFALAPGAGTATSIPYVYLNNGDTTFTLMPGSANYPTQVQSFYWSPDGKYAAIGTTSGNTTGTVLQLFQTGNTLFGITANSSVPASILAYKTLNNLRIVKDQYNVGLVYYNPSTTGATSVFATLASLNLTDTTVTNMYFEVTITSTAASLYMNNILVGTITNSDISGLLASCAIYFKNSFINSGSSSFTKSAFITDLYITDGSGTANTGRLGPSSISTVPAIADGFPPSYTSLTWTLNGGSSKTAIFNADPIAAGTNVSTISNTAAGTIIGTYSPIDNIYAYSLDAYAYSNAIGSSTITLKNVGGQTNISPQTGTATKFQMLSDTFYNQVLMANNSAGTVYTFKNNSGSTFTATTGANTPPSAALTIAKWSPDGKYVAMGLSSTTNNVIVYKNNNNGTLTALTAPTQIGTVTITDLCWGPDSSYFLVATTGGATSVYLYANNNNDTFGNPVGLISAVSYSVAVSPDGRYVAAGLASGAVNLYKFVSPTALTLATSGSVGNANNVISLSWSYDSNYLLVGISTTALYGFVNNRNDTISSMGTIASALSGTVRKIAFSYDSNYLAIATSNGILCYKNNRDLTFTASTVSTAVGGQVNAIDWTPDSNYLLLATSVTGTYFSVYQNVSGTFNKITVPASPNAALGAICVSPSFTNFTFTYNA